MIKILKRGINYTKRGTKLADWLIGERFGRLVVIKFYGKDKHRNILYECQCDCGNIKVVPKKCLISGSSKSCGCIRKENAAKIAKLYVKKTNKYNISGEYGIGYTSNEKKFYFDLEDYGKIKDYCWSNSNGYMVAFINGKLTTMHRYLLNCMDENIEIDHKNHNRSDNRRNNIRMATNTENKRNRKLRSNNTSGYTGVRWSKKENRWTASITINKKRIHLGYFIEKYDAIKARKEAEEKYFGEFRFREELYVGI